MKTGKPDSVSSDDIDWSLTTFEGVRREQLRRWSKLPLEDVIRSLEEMENLAQTFRRMRESSQNSTTPPTKR